MKRFSFALLKEKFCVKMQKSKMCFECKFLSALLLMLLGTIKEIECLGSCVNATLEIVSGSRLPDAVLQTKNVSSKIDCIFSCAQDSCCRSLNYRYRSPRSEQSECELLHNTVHNTSKALEEDSSYDHVFLTEPMKEYNPTCIPKGSKEIEVTVIGKSCAEIYKSGERQDGIYTIAPDGLGSFQVKCLMTLDSGGWTVIQRRQDGSEDFYRNWMDYKNGFGNLSGEFWLGLDKIHRLTNSGQNVSLRIDMTAKNNEQFYAKYEKFFVSNESEQYKLDVGEYSGNVHDSMAYHNGYKFYTKDKDSGQKCAKNTKKGGWWYYQCAAANPNGPYGKEPGGLYWGKIGSNNPEKYPKTFQMAIRPRPETKSKPSPPSNFGTG